MKILVNDFAGHPFPLQLSRALAASGEVVRHTYFGANNTPKGRVQSDDANLEITNLRIPQEFKKLSLLSRRSADIAYGKQLAGEVARFRPDVVLSGNTPLDAQRLALHATRDAGGSFVFWLQDVLSVAAAFVLRRKHIPFASLAGAYYRHMEKGLLQESDAVVCIAPEFRTFLESWKMDTAKVHIIENWASLQDLHPLPKDNAWAREQGIADRFCFMYSGTLGMKHKPELLLELARRCQSHEGTVVMVIADGQGAEWLREHAGEVSPSALRLLPFQPYERLPEVLSSSDVLISLLDEECGEFAVPSKTLSYLCVGRPLLIAAPLQNLAGRIVTQAGAGRAVRPVEADFLTAAMALLEDSEERGQCGRRARQYAEQTFDIDRITRKFLEVFRAVRGKA